MRFLSKTYLLSLLVFGLIMSSCGGDDDDPVVPIAPVNEEELITTMKLTFRPTGGSAQRVFLFRDLDGDGGNAPVISTDPLNADSVYDVEVTLLNEQASPVQDLTGQIRAEGFAHQFFYEPTFPNGFTMDFNYEDGDFIGDPIGILTTCNVYTTGIGTVKVTLRHGLNKGAPAVGTGDIRNAGGETDIEVVFPVTVQ